MLSALTDYLNSIRARDPAPRSNFEILLYPGVWALGFHRLAHWLFEGGLYFPARFINHLSRLLTAIDIHPGAKIGKYFFIDHGFTVIGETAVIGDNVTIYQSVTLGGTNPTNGVGGKRHPTIENDVIIGSGAQILGPVTVGERARIGAAAVVTEDVPAGATMIGVKARSTLVKAETYAREFIPYGTPCSEMFDPATQSLEILQCELETLQKKVAAEMKKRSEAEAAAKTTATPKAKPARKSKSA